MHLALVALYILACNASAHIYAYGEQRSFPKPLAELCNNPKLELQTLAHVNLTEFQRTASQWRTSSPRRLDQLLRHRLLLSESLLQKSVSNVGNVSGLQRAAHKLLSGNSVTVVALGGSVSAGNGLHDPSNGWVNRVFAWIRETSPAAKHKLINSAIPAVTSGYVSGCVPELVPDDVDLVILEFTYNDWVLAASPGTGHASRRGLERLLRRLAALPSRPGLLYVHYWPARFFLPASHASGDEELVDRVLAHYGVPTLSMRNSIQPLLASTPALIDLLWRPESTTKIHPTCVGTRFLADLVIGHLQSVAADLLDEQSAPVLAALAKRPRNASELPPLFFKDNWSHAETRCVLEAELPAWVTRADGWRWIDEARSTQHHKRGFISTNPGARLVIQVPLKRLSGVLHPARSFLVGIGALLSYERMGTMALSCSGDCSCPVTRYSAHHDEKFSMTGWRYLNVTAFGGGDCFVAVDNLPPTASGEHKLKISSLMVSERPQALANA